MKYVIVVIALFLLIGVSDYSVDQVWAFSDTYSTGDTAQDMVIDHLAPALAGAAARLYYQGICQEVSANTIPPSVEERLQFPPVQVTPTDGVGLNAVREILKNNLNVEITESVSGMPEIRIGDMSTAILQTKVSVIRFTPIEQYNPNPAIETIENAAEITGRMPFLRLRFEPLYHAELLAQPRKDLPHLPASIVDVTMDQALDLVAATFKGIVVYGICSTAGGESTSVIQFIGTPKK